MDELLMPLPPGSLAPSFTLPRTQNEAFCLTDGRGHPLVLLFYPGDWEPASAAQLTRCQTYLDELERFGALLVGISVDSVWSHLAFSRAHGLLFPLLSDAHPLGDVSRAYGVYLEAEGTSGRALFVLDASGRIRWSRVYPDNVDPGMDGILTALEGLQDES